MSDSDSEDNGSLPDGQMENGHLPPRPPEQRSDYGQYDIDLPMSHRYLGKLENVSGYVWYDDSEIVTLPAIQTNTLVFPGFTLPLVIGNDLEINMLQQFTNRKNAFVLLTPNETFQGIFKYGVIMEIFETDLRNSVLYLKAKCRQRCQLIPGKEVRTLMNELYLVTVKALQEPKLSSPICNTQLNALRSKRRYKCTEHRDIYKLRKYRKFHLCQYPLASWVYDQHEICFLVDRLLKGLAQFYLVEHIPVDAVQLSYWFVQNFQLRHEERLNVMATATTMERLRLELKFINMKRLICCVDCRAEIAKHSDVFAMSKDGVQSNYCNPYGSVFETVTVSTAKKNNVKLVGDPSAQFSWFPGYKWTRLQCRICNSHLGWKFTSPTLRPHSFYGLAKSGFDVKIVKEA